MRLTILVAFAALSIPAWAQKEPLATQVLRVPGMAPGAGAAFDPEDEFDGGQIWLVEVAGGKRVRIDKDGGYRTPVLAPDGAHVYALRDAVVRFPVGGGDAEEVLPLEGATKLVGFAPDGRLLVMVDAGDPPMVGFLAVETKKLTWLTVDESSDADKAAIARLRGWERAYGETVLSVDKRTGGDRRWTDVFLRTPGKEPANVSRCERASCGQASLAAGGRIVLFVLSPQ